MACAPIEIGYVEQGKTQGENLLVFVIPFSMDFASCLGHTHRVKEFLLLAGLERFDTESAYFDVRDGAEET